MFRFEKEQSVWDFNGTMIGGQPGEYPTAFAASIFYNKHEVVLDDKTGKIDKETAEALWNRCQEAFRPDRPSSLYPDYRGISRGL